MYDLGFWKNNAKKDRCEFLSFDKYNPVFCFEKKDWVVNEDCKRCLQSKYDICHNLLDKAKQLATSRSDMLDNNFYLIDITDEFASNFIGGDNLVGDYYLQVYFQHSNKYDTIMSSYKKDFDKCWSLDFHEVMESITEKDIK